MLLHAATRLLRARTAAAISGLALFANACMGDDPRAGSSGGSFDPPTTVPTGPCSTGSQRTCHITLGENDGVVTCFVGIQHCEAGSWGACVDGETKSLAAPWKSTALSTAVDCDNPCDPGCWVFEEEPEEPWLAGGQAKLYQWDAGLPSDVPDDLWQKGHAAPCEVGADCQMNSRCVRPSGADCAHNVCDEGGGLDATCSRCADLVCEQDPFCCERSTGGDACTHEECIAGEALPRGCSVCAETVCDQDPSCCLNEWTAGCAAIAQGLSQCSCSSASDAGDHCVADGLTTELNTTTFGTHGNMFDVEARSPLQLTGVAMHLNANGHTVSVFYREGGYQGYQNNPYAWRKVAQHSVTSTGVGDLVDVPFSVPIDVPAGATIGLYVTTHGGDNVIYTRGQTLGAVWAEDAHLRIFEGLGKKYLFGAAYTPRNFNGSIYYEHCFGGDCDHDELTAGGRLDSKCSQCAADVCDGDATCCTQSWTNSCVSLASQSSSCGCDPTGTCDHDPHVAGAALVDGCSSCASDVCAQESSCCGGSWSGLCVELAGQMASCTCQNDVSPCQHDPCITGTALAHQCSPAISAVCDVQPQCCDGYWDVACVSAFTNLVPGQQCASSWAGAWDAACTSAVETVCDATCPEPAPSVAGRCVTWLPGEYDEGCGAPDLGVGVGCGAQVLVCNHGGVEAPAGLPIDVYAPDSGGFGEPNPSATPVASCTTTDAVPSGECRTTSGCGGLVEGAEIHVNPPASGQSVAECNTEDNWGLWATATCGEPSCSGVKLVADIKPVNLFITLDKSGSMKGTRWANTISAFKQFFASPDVDGMRVALEFFPKNGCGNSNAECADPFPCSDPTVALDSLTADAAPTDAHEGALVAALDAHSPGGGTPAVLAFEGCHLWAAGRASQFPEERNVCILVTDGFPTTCGSAHGPFVQLATDGLADYGTLSYGIGIVGAEENLLNAIATAGDGNAYFISSNGNLEQQLIAALEDIRGQAIECSVEVASGDAEVAGDATVSFRSGDGQTTTIIPKKTGAGDCNGGPGWYLDDPLAPALIELCPTSCGEVQNDSLGTLDIYFPCPGALEKAERSEVYESVCPDGTQVQWGYLAYDAFAPSTSHIDFFVRSASTVQDLANRPWSPLVVAGNEAGDLPEVCPMNGSVSECPVNLYEALGVPAAKQSVLELRAELVPNQTLSQGPALNSWSLSYSCREAE